MKATAPRCDRMSCPEQADTVREIHMEDGSKSYEALCAAHATEYDLELQRLRDLSAIHGREE